MFSQKLDRFQVLSWRIPTVLRREPANILWTFYVEGPAVPKSNAVPTIPYLWHKHGSLFYAVKWHPNSCRYLGLGPITCMASLVITGKLPQPSVVLPLFLNFHQSSFPHHFLGLSNMPCSLHIGALFKRQVPQTWGGPAAVFHGFCPWLALGSHDLQPWQDERLAPGQPAWKYPWVGEFGWEAQSGPIQLVLPGETAPWDSLGHTAPNWQRPSLLGLARLAWGQENIH